jgi:hypothetical protein
MSSIFINIAAYHDYELGKTINSLINNSSGNNDLFFGVHYVYEDEDNIDAPKYNNVDYIVSKAPENLGIGTGRYIANTLYKGQDYYMVIDSHSRVIKNWDEYLIADVLMYQSEGHAKPVLTCYPAAYWYDEEGNEVLGDNYGPQNIDFNKNEYFQDRFAKELNASNTGSIENSKYQKSISGGFTFTISPYITINKDITFAEEFAVGAMLYTNGFDLLIPTKLVIYHYYSNPSIGKFEEHKRRSIWQYEKNDKILSEISKISQEINYKMFNENIVGEGFLGSERSLDDYANYANINFKDKVLL